MSLRSAGQSVKTLALLFATLTTAKPLHHVRRQSSAAPVNQPSDTASSSTPPTASATALSTETFTTGGETFYVVLTTDATVTESASNTATATVTTNAAIVEGLDGTSTTTVIIPWSDVATFDSRTVTIDSTGGFNLVSLPATPATSVTPSSQQPPVVGSGTISTPAGSPSASIAVNSGSQHASSNAPSSSSALASLNLQGKQNVPGSASPSSSVPAGSSIAQSGVPGSSTIPTNSGSQYASSSRAASSRALQGKNHPVGSVSALASSSGTMLSPATTASVGGVLRTCSVQSVSATTIAQPTVTAIVTTYTEPAITLVPTLGCTCNDGWMAGIGTSHGIDGLETVTCEFGSASNPAIMTQTSALVPDPTYVAEWCQDFDLNDPDVLIELWEDKNVSWTLNSYTNNNPSGWLTTLVDKALPNNGDTGVGGCGVLGSSCNIPATCSDMVSRGFAAEYWIIQAVQGFHYKLNVANTFLQTTTIEDILSLDQIASDFSAPQDTGMNTLWAIAGLIGTACFLGGAADAVIGVVSSEIGIAAKAAEAAAAAGAKYAKGLGDDITATAQDGIAEAAGKVVAAADATTRVTGALGAGLFATGSTFNAIRAYSSPTGQVTSGDLEPILNQMFSAASAQMGQLGNTALGRGGNYSLLPFAQGSGYGPQLPDTSYVAGFFADGKFLLDDSNPTFNQSIETSYGSFKAKIVDQALQTAGYIVFGFTDLTSEADCTNTDYWGGYGAQWLSPLNDGNFYCMQLYINNHGGGCGSDSLGTCDYVVATQDNINKVQDTYGFNMANYYTAAAQCNHAQLPGDVPNYTTYQADGITPVCYYNIAAQKAKIEQNCSGFQDSICHRSVSQSNF